MLNQSDAGPDRQWSTVRSQLSSLAAFSAVSSEEDRQRLFQEYVTDLQVPPALSSATAHVATLLTRVLEYNGQCIAGFWTRA